MVYAIQLVGMVFALFMMYYTFIHYQRKETTKPLFWFWEFVWLFFFVVAFYPDLLLPLKTTLAITRLMDLLIVLGFLFLLALTYYNYFLVTKLSLRLQKLIQKIAEDNPSLYTTTKKKTTKQQVKHKKH